MNYASPEATHICTCRDNGMAPMFCPTGHLTECHLPLDCRQAACGHLPRYDEEMDQSGMAQLEELAVSRLQQLAESGCTQCGGEGRTEMNATVSTPDGEKFQFTSTAICPCVSNPTARRAQEDAGKT